MTKRIRENEKKNDDKDDDDVNTKASKKKSRKVPRKFTVNCMGNIDSFVAKSVEQDESDECVHWIPQINAVHNRISNVNNQTKNSTSVFLASKNNEMNNFDTNSVIEYSKFATIRKPTNKKLEKTSKYFKFRFQKKCRSPLFWILTWTRPNDFLKIAKKKPKCICKNKGNRGMTCINPWHYA